MKHVHPMRISQLAVLLLVAGSTGCQSSTDLGGESLEGRWDGVGSLYELAPGLSLFVEDGGDGTFSGSWTQGVSSNAVTNGSHQNGVVRFTLVGFKGGTRVFEGSLTHRYRMEGQLAVDGLNGAAVFRRSSFSATAQ